MSRDLVIGVDCSTTACKAVVWDMSGKAIAIGRHGYGLDHVRSGWVEQNAADGFSYLRAPRFARVQDRKAFLLEEC